MAKRKGSPPPPEIVPPDYEVIFTWPDGRQEVRYWRPNSDPRCRDEVASLRRRHRELGYSGECPYSIREIERRPTKFRCWMSNVEFAKRKHGEGSQEYAKALDRPSTCLLPNGHDGPHRWTFDGDVTFAFSPKTKE